MELFIYRLPLGPPQLHEDNSYWPTKIEVPLDYLIPLEMEVIEGTVTYQVQADQLVVIAQIQRKGRQ